MTASLGPDPYAWWTGRQVHLRVASPSDWQPAQVLESKRDVSHGVWPESDDWYEAEFGESNGRADIVVLAHGATRQSVEIYAGGPHGIMPNVVDSYQWSDDLSTWWRSLDDNTRRLLLAEPGVVPTAAIAAVAHSGIAATGAYWPSTQAGPDEFHLPALHTALVQDVGLVRGYEAAQDEYDRVLRGADLSAALSGAGPGVDYLTARAVIEARDAAKLALDGHRAALIGG